ncbi:hypothetical protein LT85_0973 [Collimonas arenae]|uniref:Lipoprotein n=1 Tax=Collimonas arenae TaxID=279058 RepID=A0A0A1F6G9_9BURK|nr:hypothetical protein [Collimonas arenae]AIY40131.1 hypothetical protein LT85_0973 [Collimonas arenae]
MQNAKQKNVVSQFATIASLLCLAALTACGGGDSGNSTASTGSSTTPATTTPPATTPSVNALAFNRMGTDFYTGGATSGIDLGATIDASANITFTHQPIDSLDHSPAFNFTFPSGLAGGSVTASHIFSTNDVAANKNIRILNPNATKTIQNVYWRNIDDASTAGFDLAGYQSDLTTLTWPSSGTATYVGQAFQYISEVSNIPGNTQTARALYSSDVTATVDYAAQKVTFAIAPNPVLIDSSGTPSATDPSKFASTFTYTGITYTALNNGIVYPHLTTGFGLVNGPVPTFFRFFGTSAEELGAYFQFSGPLPNSIEATQILSMALRKQ